MVSPARARQIPALFAHFLAQTIRINTKTENKEKTQHKQPATMMISRAAVAAATDGRSVVGPSVEDINMPTAAASAAIGEQQPKRQPKLTLEQKRELVMTWFTSQPGDADVRIKDLPNGKAFVRRAARDLRLVQLRRLRRSLSSSDEVQRASIDDMARRRVVSYHPRKFATAAQQEQKNISPITTSLDRDQIRSTLLAFYGSTGRDAVPLGRHLRNCGVLAQKRDILAIVRSIGLRRMKRDGVSVEEATAKLDEVLSTVSFAEHKKEVEASVVDCADHLDAMQIDEDAAASRVIDTKAKRQATRIAERRAQRKAQRQAMVEAKRAARILKKQQQQQQQQQLPDKALTIIQSNPSLLKLVQSDNAQTLLMEWYVDPSKPSIVDFLTSKDEANGGDSSLLDTYKRPLRLLVKAGQLQRLRKAGAGRGKAARAVEGVLARASITTTPTLQVKNDKMDFGIATASNAFDEAVVVDVNVDDDNTDIVGGGKKSEHMKLLLTDWYTDAKMRPPRKFFQQEMKKRGLVIGNLALVISKMKASGLIQLRKKREEAGAVALAMARIDRLGQDVDIIAKTKLIKGDKPVTGAGTTNKGTVAKVFLKKNPNSAAALTSITQDDLQKHLMQWFQDDSIPSVVDFLAANDLPSSLRPAMAHMIKQLGLRQLRKDRRMASVQARRRINGALKGKVGLQDKGKKDTTGGDVPTIFAILPSAPPAELLEEEDEYVSVSKEGAEEMKDDEPPSYDDAIVAEDKTDLDLDFVVLH